MRVRVCVCAVRPNKEQHAHTVCISATLWKNARAILRWLVGTNRRKVCGEPFKTIRARSRKTKRKYAGSINISVCAGNAKKRIFSGETKKLVAPQPGIVQAG